MSARKFVRVELAPTTFSHILCIACGGFNVDFAIVTTDIEDSAEDGFAGIHKKCMAKVKVKRGAP